MRAFQPATIDRRGDERAAAPAPTSSEWSPILRWYPDMSASRRSLGSPFGYDKGCVFTASTLFVVIACGVPSYDAVQGLSKQVTHCRSTRDPLRDGVGERGASRKHTKPCFAAFGRGHPSSHWDRDRLFIGAILRLPASYLETVLKPPGLEARFSTHLISTTSLPNGPRSR